MSKVWQYFSFLKGQKRGRKLIAWYCILLIICGEKFHFFVDYFATMKVFWQIFVREYYESLKKRTFSLGVKVKMWNSQSFSPWVISNIWYVRKVLVMQVELLTWKIIRTCGTVNSWWVVPRISSCSRRNIVISSRWFCEAHNDFTTIFWKGEEAYSCCM